MFAQQRRLRILEILNAEMTVSVNELASRLDASRETIRRDLRALEKEGVCMRTHGGAYLSGPLRDGKDPSPSPAAERNVISSEDSYSERILRDVPGKQAVAKKAASLIRDKDTVFIDNSTTTLFIPQFIPKDLHVVILTNSYKVLTEGSALGNPNLTFITLAGIYNSANYSVYGTPAVKSVEGFFPDKCFLSCCGIDPDKGLTDTSLYEIDIRLALISKSAVTCLLAVPSKFRTNGPFYLGDIGLVDILITGDCSSDPAAMRNLDRIRSSYSVRVISC